MRRSVPVVLLATALTFVACSEQPTEITAPPNTPAPTANVAVGCPVITAVKILDLVNQLVPPGTIRNNITKQINKLPAKKEARIKTAIRNQIFTIQDLILKAYYAGLFVGGTSATTLDQVLDLIEALYCYVDLTPPAFPATTEGADIVVGVVFPTSPPTTFAVPSEKAAVTIGTGAAPSPTTIVVTKLPDSPGPLRTSLDQYPFFYHFSGTTADGPVTFNLDVLAGICLKGGTEGLPPGVNPNNLRLAHNISPLDFGDVEVLPQPGGAVPGLDCSDLPSGGGLGLGRFDWVPRLLLPAELHAATTMTTLGVGGTTKKFSDFGIVDQTSNPGVFSGVSSLSSTEAGGSTVTRTVLVTSHNGTPINRAPVTFATSDGTLVGDSPAFTGPDGKASVSWTLPTAPGDHTLDASVPQRDNSPLGVTNPPATNVASFPDLAFNLQSVTFTAGVGFSDAGVITNAPNGLLSLGVNPMGNLITPDGVGLRFGAAEALAVGDLTEGWGFGDATGGVVGHVNVNQGPAVNLVLESFRRTTTEAVSVVRVGTTFRVTHHLRPSASPNLYEMAVTVANLSGSARSVEYRRIMDWDIPPTAFDEFVTVAGIGNPPGVQASNNGPSASANPQASLGGSQTGNFSTIPSGDFGTVFDVPFALPAGGSKDFLFYYGAAGTFAAARTAAVSQGLEVVTLARPNSAPFLGAPNTFIGGFKGLGGSALTEAQIPLVNPSPGLLQLLRQRPSTQVQQQQ